MTGKDYCNCRHNDTRFLKLFCREHQMMSAKNDIDIIFVADYPEATSNSLQKQYQHSKILVNLESSDQNILTALLKLQKRFRIKHSFSDKCHPMYLRSALNLTCRL